MKIVHPARLLISGLLAAGLLATLSPPATAQRSDPQSIEAWEVPWADARPRDPFVDGQGRVWFCGQTGNFLAYLEPDSGAFERYELPANSGPHNLIVDDDGFVWYAGNRNAHIGRLDPESGDIVQFPMPDAGARDPHTLVFGEGDDLWFTVQQGNFVGRLDRASGEVRLIAVPTRNARPYGIKFGPDGSPWIVLLGSNRLATVDPDTMELSEVEIPRAGARARRLEIDAAGSVWYVDFAGGMLGRYVPATGAFSEWPMPGGARSAPYGTAMDHLGRIWIAETGSFPNRLIGFDPAGESFFSDSEIASGGSVRHMVFHEASREIWFGVDTGFMVRVRLGE